MNRTCLSVLALLGAVVASPVQADEPRGFYASLLLGANEFDDLPVDGGPILDELELDRGAAYGVAAGVSLPWHFPLRLEGEFVHGSADAEELPALGLTDLDGSVDVQTFMLNAIADGSLAEGAIRPYIGVGAGWASVEIDEVGTAFLALAGDDDVFAWQGLVGVGVPISEQLTLSLDARFLRTDEVSYLIGPGAAIPAGGELEATRVVASLRYRF